ncbi:hypothetical protein [Litorimonas sp. WD9-15]|uniref:hypothetical protein n=1 Tax=Litorimonas sp. WD9-15 TaxID=3418716 RepID=UPI003CFE920B
MNTPTHTLLALAALSKRGDRKRNLAVLIGSLIPDAALFLWAPYQYLVNDVSGTEMWETLYFGPTMQNLIAWFNSIPIYALLAIIGFAAREKTWGKLLLFFALAALIHMATDLPVHAEDAYRHFWPLTDWRFYSPLSYWDADHHSRWVSLFEIALAFGCIVLLWRRFPKLWVKITLSLTSFFYIALLAAFVIFR